MPLHIQNRIVPPPTKFEKLFFEKKLLLIKHYDVDHLSILFTLLHVYGVYGAVVGYNTVNFDVLAFSLAVFLTEIFDIAIRPTKVNFAVSLCPSFK